MNDYEIIAGDIYTNGKCKILIKSIVTHIGDDFYKIIESYDIITGAVWYMCDRVFRDHFKPAFPEWQQRFDTRFNVCRAYHRGNTLINWDKPEYKDIIRFIKEELDDNIKNS